MESITTIRQRLMLSVLAGSAVRAIEHFAFGITKYYIKQRMYSGTFLGAWKLFLPQSEEHVS